MSWSDPRSAITRAGRRRARPSGPRTRLITSSRGTRWVMSLSLAGVADQANRSPRASVISWCLSSDRPRSTEPGASSRPLVSPARTWRSRSSGSCRSHPLGAGAPTTPAAADPRPQQRARHAAWGTRPYPSRRPAVRGQVLPADDRAVRTPCPAAADDRPGACGRVRRNRLGPCDTRASSTSQSSSGRGIAGEAVVSANANAVA